MEQATSRYERLDFYLAQMEAYEKAKRIRRLLGIGAFFVICTILVWFFLPHEEGEHSFAPKPLRRYAALTLTPDKVQDLFVSSPEPLVVVHPIAGIDTIASMDDYYDFLNRLDLMAMDIAWEGEGAVELGIENNPQDPTSATPKFNVSVSGEKRVGSPLLYTIEPYDPSYRLILDFGNGIQRAAAGRETSYTYPLPGHFDFHLVLQDEDSSQILQVLKYEILPKEDLQASTETAQAGTQRQGLQEPADENEVAQEGEEATQKI